MSLSTLTTHHLFRNKKPPKYYGYNGKGSIALISDCIYTGYSCMSSTYINILNKGMENGIIDKMKLNLSINVFKKALTSDINTQLGKNNRRTSL